MQVGKQGVDFSFEVMVSYPGKPGQEPEVETTDEHCFLVCTAWWFLRFAVVEVLSYTGTTYPEEALLTVG